MIRRVERATVDVYEQRAREWRDKRPARFPERAEALAAAVGAGAIRADVGCGAGLHLPMLGRPVVALDAAFAMLELAREAAPDAWLVQADVEAMPFRNGALGAAWARATYLHLRRTRLPWALMQLHRALAVGARVALTMCQGDAEGELPDDDFAGRFFAEWRPEPLREVLGGAGFDVTACTAEPPDAEWINVDAIRARTLPDFIDEGMRLLIVGLNPSLYAADAGVGFARPGNRFWPAALAAGIVTRDRDPLDALRSHAIGMTDLVKRATVGADELTRDEYRAGAARVERIVHWLRPAVVCFVGLAGWRAAIDAKAKAGEQLDGFGGSRAYVMPNTSGLNARTTLDELVQHLRAAMALA
jgi:TDG/mug DNA glycosylase family protein